MAPKKGQKMSLNAFLEDSTLGSWADEMESLPTAPAPRQDDGSTRGGDRGFGRKDDFLSSRPDRAAQAPREDIPLPTQAPYTAFIGNLAFDLTDTELENFFAPHEIIKVKIIKDHEDKPKGFGYVEFADVEGLKDALAKSGSTLSNRGIRVNVAEPQKDRAGGFGSGDDDKFAAPWRRDGPLPDLQSQGRDGPGRRRYEGLSEPTRESLSEGNSDWRSNRAPPRFPAEPEGPPRRRGSGFSTPTHEGELSPADAEEKWTIGGRFKASTGPGAGAGSDSQPGSRFGSLRSRGDMGPPASSPEGESDWRKARPAGLSSTSPTSSVPSTPQLARRKLELLPRSTNTSALPTPLSSPKSASQSSITTSARSNPFGAAKPVDVSAREAVALEKIEKEREQVKERVAQHPMSRQSSRQARERPAPSSVNGDRSGTPPAAPLSDAAAAVESASSPTATSPSSPRPAPAAISATVRPTFSFAKAAAGKKDGTAPAPSGEAAQPSEAETAVEQVSEKLAEMSATA